MANNTNFRIGQQVEWFIGPRRIRRTGRVLDVGFASGAIRVYVAGAKTSPVRTVEPSCQPRVLAQLAQ